MLYDGACLLCRRKIAVYRDLQLAPRASSYWRNFMFKAAMVNCLAAANASAQSGAL
jgi:hypothetical protein